jgi:hypothetical protein
VGTALLNLRLFLLHKDAKYIDVLERNLYNGVMAGVSLKGDEFFYPNPLASEGTNRQHVRSPWFKTACCPSNIERFMPSVPGYVYAHTEDELYVNLYVGSTARVKLAGRNVRIIQKTGYPWDGQVEITVTPETAGEFDILLRIPGWARNRPVPSDLYRYMKEGDTKITLKVNDKKIPTVVEKGYVRIRCRWKTGDVVKLNIPMPIRRVLAHPRVKDNLGRVAVERGPIVYCAEWRDNGGRALDLVLADDVKLTAEHRKDMLDSITVITGKLSGGGELTLIPYYAWAHRGPGEMAVWLAREWQPFITSHASPKHTPAALNDGLEPKNSCDHGIPHFSWGRHTNRVEWVQQNFYIPRKLSAVEVYWYDDESIGGACRMPRSWSLMYRDGDGWKPVSGASRAGTAKDEYNKVTFQPVMATALRIEVRLQGEFTAGILEWKVN